MVVNLSFGNFARSGLHQCRHHGVHAADDHYDVEFAADLTSRSLGHPRRLRLNILKSAHDPFGAASRHC